MKITKWMRILLVCLSFVMALSLFSCKTEEQPPATSEEQTTTGTQEGSTTKETVDSTEATEATTEATDTTGTETETTGTETATSDTEATDTSDTEATDTSDTETNTSDTEATDTSDTETNTSDTEATDTSDTETTESSETETTETEETECQHEDKEEVAAKAANCKKGGNEAYVICNACGVMWNTDGAVIEAIPETPIDPDVHLAKEEVPAKLPTTKEEGNAAYSECRGCRKYWNADGEEITEDQIVKYPVIVPTTNYYFGAAELEAITVSGTPTSKFTKEMAADRSYVTFARDGEAEDGNIVFFETEKYPTTDPITKVSGQYLIVKYRTSTETYMVGWFNTEGGLDGGACKDINLVSDGEWHIIILDLAAFKPEFVKPNGDGEYVLKWARFDVLDKKATEGSIDIAYVAIADDYSKLVGVMQDDDMYICPHAADTSADYIISDYGHARPCIICGESMPEEEHAPSAGTVYNAETKTYVGTCVCGETTSKSFLLQVAPTTAGMSGASFQATVMDGFTRFTRVASGETFISLISGNTLTTGQYAIVKYRIPEGTIADNQFYNCYGATAQSANTGAKGANDPLGKLGSLVADGEWHYTIIDLGAAAAGNANNTEFKEVDGKYAVKYVRASVNFNGISENHYIDVAFIAFADQQAALENYAYISTPGNIPENPIWVEDFANTSIKVGAGQTVYVNARAAGMILTLTGNATVKHNGETYTAVDGVVTIPECVGDMWTPSTFEITNNGEEDATYTMTFTWPKGHMENPEDLVDGDNVVNIEAGNDQGYFFEWTAPYDGTLTLKFDSDAGWIYSISNMTTCQYGDICYSDDDPVVDTVELTVKAGDVIQIMVNTYDPDAPWAAPEGAVAVEATFAAAPGTEVNPILFESDNNTITVPAGATVYYQAYCAGMIFTLAGDATVGFNGETYTAVDGKVEFLIPAPTMMGRVPPSVFAITNNGEADAEYTVSFAYPAGHMENPAEAVEGDNTVNIEANSQGYFFTITAPEDGILVTAISSTTGWTYCINNMTSNKYGDNITSEGGSATAKTAVKAGDVIQIMVNTLNPADPWNIPAGDITLNISFTDCDHANKGDLTAKVDATCTEDGCEAYYVCADCGKYLNENEVVIEAPVVIPAGHKMVNVEAKAPTCTEAGNEAYSYCSVCDKKLAADGAEITEIPTIPATNHKGTVTVYEKKYATTQEKGNEKYSACGACGAMWNADDEVITSVPELELLAPTTNYYFGAAELENIKIDGTTGMKAVVSADRSYVSFNRAKEGGDGNITLIVDDASIEKVSGKYFVIKYRTTSEKYIQAWFSTTGFDASAHKDFNIINDGEWHILVMDIAAFNSANVVADDNGNYILKWARLDILDANATEGGIDIAYTAIADDLAKFATVTQEGDDKICDHNATITAPVWNETNKNYDINCICGATTKDYLYKTESNLTANTKSLSVTVMDGFVRYTAIGTADPYFFPIADNTTYVTGNYLVIKYRLVNNNQDSGVGQRFAASALSENNTAKANGDQKGIITYGNLIGDGEWHYYVVAIDLASTDPNTQFIANEDGTYTWKYLRLTFASPAATDGSCYLDIDYLMFADHLEQFDELIYNDLYKDNIPFRPNVDGTNNSINGEAFTTSTQKDGTIEFDLDGKTVNDPTEGFMLGGWLCTPGGIESYKIRVTKVDGVAVAAPVLVDWQTGANALDIYKAVGKPRNYSISSAYHARFNKMAINLAAYAGQKIDFEVVAITNFGEELTIIKVNNLTVAEFECPHSEFTNVDAKAPTCTEAGYEAYKVCKTCSQKFTMEGEELDAPVAVPAAHKYVEHAEVASTCTVAGTGFYKSCEGCDKLFNAENAEITEIPALDLAEHTLEEVAAKAATCEEAGYEAYKACSVCSKKFSMEGAEIEAPTAIPASHKYVEHAEVPSTCKVAGTGFYKSCENCNKLFNAENAVIDAIPALPLSTTHSYVTVEAKDPTCTEAGNEAYSYCSVCDKKLAANGAEITEIPTIAATNHEGTVTVYEKKYATTQEKGNEKYSVCSACNTMWNADGEVTDAVPEIPVIVPTTNYYWGVEELNGKKTGTVPSKTVISADRKYIRFERTGNGSDGMLYFVDLPNPTDKVSGQYFVIKYRTNESIGEGFGKTVEGSTGSDDWMNVTLKGDEQWHIAIIDLAAKGKNIKANEDGEYCVRIFRIDIFNDEKSTGYFEIEYAMLFDNFADAAAMLPESDKVYCGHSFTGMSGYTQVENGHTITCDLCGASSSVMGHAPSGDIAYDEATKGYGGQCVCGKMVVENYLVLSEAVSNNKAASVNTEVITENGESFVRYTRVTTSDPYAVIYSGSAVTGRYMLIKYRVTDANSYNVSRTFYSTTTSGAVAGNQSKISAITGLVCDGKWNYYLVDLGAISNAEFVAANNTYSLKFFRMDINAGTLDIAFVAFADRFEALHEYAQKDSGVCAHHNYDCTYTATETANSYSVYCNRCKTDLGVVNGISSDGYKVITPEIFNVTQAYGAGESTADTSKPHFEYSVKTEGMLSYVHIDFTQATNKESYMYLQKGLTNTGKYVAVIYRSNNVDAGEVFITGGNQGTASGQCKATSWNINASEWTLAIFDFSKDADCGWNEFLAIQAWRWDINNAVSEDSWLDIASIAFFDSKAEADLYYVEFLESYGIAAFNTWVDYVRTDFGDSLGSAGGGSSKVTKDLNAETTAAPASTVQVAGWFATNGGVKAYYYRVNGGEWIAVDPVTSGAISDSSTSGAYTSTDAKYDGHDKGILFNNGTGISTHDLSADYAGQTVTVEFGACPNDKPGTDEQPNVVAFVAVTGVHVATAE